MKIYNDISGKLNEFNYAIIYKPSFHELRVYSNVNIDRSMRVSSFLYTTIQRIMNDV